LSRVDRDLGMDRRISRRDFMNGVALAIGGAALHLPRSARLETGDDYAPERDPSYYPPALQGMRGSHPGSFEIAHLERDGRLGAMLASAQSTNESYELVVVGAGISGLAAAHFFRQAAGKGARILLLDNHDDFGGHAKRNEFAVGRHRLLGYGGTQSIDGPDEYSPVSRQLLAQLGVDLSRFEQAFDRRFYASRHMAQGIFFDASVFGRDHLAVGAGTKPWTQLLTGAPLSEAARRDVVRVYEGRTDYLPGLTAPQKKEKLRHTSYARYLREIARVSSDALPFFQAITHDLFGVGIDAVPAGYVLGTGFTGAMQGLGIESDSDVRSTHARATPPEGAAPYIYHFPDGNASIARLLVRRLIPGAIPGRTMNDIVTARATYAALDAPGSTTRLRLNSTVVRVEHAGDAPAATHVRVTYVRGGKAWVVTARQCVLACWNMVIPHICSGLPARQRGALAYGAKVPLVYTNVALSNWRAWHTLGTDSVYAPANFHTIAELDFPVSLGSYRFSAGPEEPIVVHMLRTPCKPGLPARDQHRAGRAELLQMPFDTFERTIRDQLGRMLGSGGFDPARDIAGITVNRWPHGYAYEYNSLWDPDWPPGESPAEIGRQRFGRIAIANSDAAASAYTNAAIDQAHRAVRELVGGL